MMVVIIGDFKMHMIVAQINWPDQAGRRKIRKRTIDRRLIGSAAVPEQNTDCRRAHRFG